MEVEYYRMHFLSENLPFCWKSYEELFDCNVNCYTPTNYQNEDSVKYDAFHDKSTALAFLSLGKLRQLRDYWLDCDTDRENDFPKYFLRYDPKIPKTALFGNIVIEEISPENVGRPATCLSFYSRYMAEWFAEAFANDIYQARMFLP